MQFRKNSNSNKSPKNASQKSPQSGSTTPQNFLEEKKSVLQKPRGRMLFEERCVHDDDDS